MSKKSSKNPRGLSGKQIFSLFVTYFIICVMLASLAFFGMKQHMGPPIVGILAAASILVPSIATWLHVRQGKKNAVSDIAKRVP